MKFTKTPIEGVYEVSLEPRIDDRGFFMRGWCEKEFQDAGLYFTFVQSNLSFNKKRGTLRGLHYQLAPHQEDKFVSCPQGAIFDVALDLRPDSKTYGKWYGAELSGENYKALLIPKGCAHGYITLQDNSLVFYQVSAFYCPEAERGICWDDSRFAISWPIAPALISKKDAITSGVLL